MPSERADGLVSRRTVLRLFASAAGVALLAACQAPAPAAPATTAPAPKPAPASGGPAPASGGPTPATAPASSAAASTDRPAQAGFLAVGVSTASTAPTTAARGQPRTGGTLRIGNLGDLPNADGHWISGQNVIYPVYDRLVDLDASLQPHPALAESWDANSDFTQVTFQVRKGVMFHSGRELTAPFRRHGASGGVLEGGHAEQCPGRGVSTCRLQRTGQQSIEVHRKSLNPELLQSGKCGDPGVGDLLGQDQIARAFREK